MARSSWAALLVPHPYMTGSTLVARPLWAALLVPHPYMTGSTSGGSFFMGCTSGAPSLHNGVYLWWLVPYGLHFWCPISTTGSTSGGSFIMGCTSGTHLYVIANHALQVSSAVCICKPRAPSRFPPLSIVPIFFVLEEYST